MNTLLSAASLASENSQFRSTKGVGADFGSQGVIPAFRDTSSGRAYTSRFADGGLAPIHLLGGLPETFVLERSTTAAVKAVKHTFVSGFLRDGYFYTRDQTAVLA